MSAEKIEPMTTGKFFAALFVCGFTWSEASAATFATYDSGDNSELLTTIPGDFSEYTLYSVPVSVATGDILVVNVEATATNDNTATAQWTGIIRFCTTACPVGTSLAYGNNFGLTHNIHHGVHIKAAVWQATANYSTAYVQFVVKSTQDLTVDQDHGRIQVLKITP
ncbi:MAG TPA: hypothetical protein VHE09_13025 [Rhizomicrobium sp.]|nr:hypothetical protein [Rhizomicrobium sp.]